jgi:hypothetical protein
LLDQDDDVITEIGRSYLNGDLHVAVNGDFARKHYIVNFSWTLYGNDSKPIATHSGTFPCHREKMSSIRGRLLGLCMATKMIQLCGHYTESTNPTIHLMQQADSTMDHTTLTMARDGYSTFIYPQTDLSTEIQQNLKGINIQWTNDKSPYKMVMPMAMIATLLEPSPVQETPYPPTFGVLYYNGDTPCGYLPKAIIKDHIHRPKLRYCIQHNISIDDTHWDKIHWAAHSTAMEESNIERLLPTIKYIHNEWPVGITPEKYYGNIVSCPHCGEEETIEHVFTCGNVPMIRAIELAFDIRKSLDKTPPTPTWLRLYTLGYVNIGAPTDLTPTSLAQHQHGIIEQDDIGSLDFIQGRIITRFASFSNNRDTIRVIASFWREALIIWSARNKGKHGDEQAKLA